MLKPLLLYKSPRHKLIRFFEKSRNQWKAKCLEAKKQIKYLKNRLKYHQASARKWRAKAKALEQELAELKAAGQGESAQSKQLEDSAGSKGSGGRVVERFTSSPAGHRYSTDHIVLFILLVLEAATSLRGSARVLEIVLNFFALPQPSPSWYSGRLWLLRLGYYKLMRAKEKATDWVWIVDHSIQLGVEKCLVILGVRLSESTVPGVLRYEDVEPIELVPVKHSNGEVVYQQLEAAASKTGIPREIVADGGSDLKAGITTFCAHHEQTCYVYDIKHKTALVLKHELEGDQRWQVFIQQAAQSKRALQQSELVHLAPPNQKSKARDMNLGALVRWGRNTLGFLEHQKREPDTDYDQTKLTEALGWVSEFAVEIQQWYVVIQLTEKVESFIRHQGIYPNCHRELERDLTEDLKEPRAQEVARQLIEFVRQEALKARGQEHLLGSSEVLESAFGGLNRIEKDQSKSGFTGLVLSVAAMMSETTEKVVAKAMEMVPVKKVIQWCHDNLGESVQSRRKKALDTCRREEQRWDYILASK